ncbi:MAG: hypothetical protein KDD60_07820 [Bdellovibrionales bacterium]|nr:hypothetical protein [Bdellovibrionales bacterium]
MASSGSWKGRITTVGIAIAAASIGAFAAFSSSDRDSMLQAVQRLAFVNAGFIVAAFNLRFRLLDIATKEWFSLTQFQNLSTLLKNCTERIGRLIFYYVLCSAAMSMAPMAIGVYGLDWVGVGFGFGIFVAGLAEFLRVLGSFRRLEEFTLTAREKILEKEQLDEHRNLFSGKQGD